MTIQKKMCAAAMALLLSLSLLLGLPGSALAEAPSDAVNRFNVVLVVDKSGSLRNQRGHGTDPDGLRFDALRLFLGLLTESGNNVGAIVFDERIRYEAALEQLDGMEQKKALIRELEYYTPSYDTDIGSAVLRATELLTGMREENGLPCMILLFSDGMTDFSTDDISGRKLRSWAIADQALETAKAQGITINGILLNVDDIAEDGRIEFQLYTHGTHGAFEEVSRPEDLAAAFRRFYAIINNARYTGSERVSFSEQGEAEYRFLVPSFGVEEVNVVVEGEHLRAGDSDDLRREGGGERVEMAIFRPDETLYDITGHDLDSARYRLVKIPHPHPGVWSVHLKGASEDWVDVTMVYNASMRVTLEILDPDLEKYEALTPYAFTVWVDDPGVPHLTDAQLAEMDARLTVEQFSTGTVREYAMGLIDGGYDCEISFPAGGDYRIEASLGVGGFEVCSNSLELRVENRPLVPLVERITDMLEFGQFRNGDWVLELDELFGTGRSAGLTYTLSDDFGGVLTAEDGVLTAALRDTETYAFTLTAEDQMGQSAEITFELTAPPVQAKLRSVMSLSEHGQPLGPRWEIDLDELFSEPKDAPLDYALSDDCGGAVTIGDGVLQVDLSELNRAEFDLSATDLTGQSAQVSFDFTVPRVTAKVDVVNNVLKQGRLDGFQWEIGLDELFDDPKGGPLEYALSDDYGGAVALTGDALTVDFEALKEAEFTLTATDTIERQAVIPFKIRLPGPAATTGAITETVKTGLFQKNKGLWETRLDVLFRDPKGTKLTYTLSDDLGGAAEIDGTTLRVNMTGQKKAAFTVTATDEYGLSADVSVTLTEKNMTIRYALWALAALTGIGATGALLLWLRRRNEAW